MMATDELRGVPLFATHRHFAQRAAPVPAQ